MEKSLQKKAEEIFATVQRIKAREQGKTKDFLLDGRDLAWVKRKGRYTHYGDHIKNFKDFCQEINIAYSTAMHSIKCHYAYRNSDVSDISIRRLIKLLPLINEKNTKDWLLKAKELPSEGFEDEVRIARGLVPKDTCDHKATQDYIMTKCKDCTKVLSIKKPRPL